MNNELLSKIHQLKTFCYYCFRINLNSSKENTFNRENHNPKICTYSTLTILVSELLNFVNNPLYFVLR